MIDFDVWTEIHARARRGEAKKKSARELGSDRQTVRRLLAQVRPATYQRMVTRPALGAPDLDDIQRRVMEVDYNASRICPELPRQGYPGGSEMVKRAVAAIAHRAQPGAGSHGPLRDAPRPPRPRGLGAWVGVDGWGAPARACMGAAPGLFARPGYGVHGRCTAAHPAARPRACL